MGAVAACPGSGFVPGLVVALLIPAAAVAAVEPAVEEEPAEVGPAAAELVGPAAAAKPQQRNYEVTFLFF